MLTYEKVLKEEFERHAETVKLIKRYEPLFEIVHEYAEKFSENHQHDGNKRHSDLTFALNSGTINALSLNLYLAPDDKIIKDIGWIVEELKDSAKFEFIKEGDYIEIGWKGWRFKFKDKYMGEESNSPVIYPEFLLRVWFGNSRHCKKVGTGKFEEVMKVECEE